MPAQIEHGEFCASYYGVYDVPGSKPGTSYVVSLGGGEGPAHCTCPAFQHFRGPQYDRTCKHVNRVWQEACMWNCQWHEGNTPVVMRPREVAAPNQIPDSHCTNCSGPLVSVLIAV